MNIIENINKFLDLIFILFLQNENLYILISLYLPLSLILIMGSLKKNSLIKVVIKILKFIYSVSDFLINYILYKLNIINVYLLTLVVFWIILREFISASQNIYSSKSHFFKIRSLYIRKMIVTELFIYVTSIYALLSISFFNQIAFIKYGLIFTYLFYFINLLININVHSNYINIYDDKEIGMKIILAYPGGGINYLPFSLLLNVWIYWMIPIISICVKIEKSRNSRGIFDLSNRTSLIVFNSDNQWQIALILISGTILISRGFDMYSFFTVFLIVSIWGLFRYKRQSIPKYITSVTGEVTFFRPNIYDGLLSRVIPENKFDFLSKSNLTKKRYSYALFFNNFKYVIDSSKGVIESSNIIKGSNHVIFIFNQNSSTINFICEYNLHISLNNPLTIIDIWSGNFNLSEFYTEIDKGYNWLNARLSLLQNLTDENFINIDGDLSSIVNFDKIKKMQKIP
jgi:hypothetical protein